MHLIQVPEEIVKSLIVWQTLVPRQIVAQSPLATQGRLVAGLLQQLGHREIVIAQRLHVARRVASHVSVSRVEPRH